MKRIFSVLFFLFIIPSLQAKPVEIVLWHSMAGTAGAEMHKLADGFNHSQADFRIKPIYKGDYIETLTSFAAAFRAKQPPSLVQVFEVGTATMLAPAGIIKPVDDIMQEQGLTLPEDSFFPVVRAYYSEKGRLQAMPFNISVPVILYNADLLAKMGYSAKSFPHTWDELEILAEKLKQAGVACTYTSAYPAWIFIEAFSAIHGLPLADATTKKAIYNNKKVVNYLTRLLRWQQLGYFEYGGRSDDATILFTSGRCPLLSQSSGGYNSLSKLVPFHVGVAALPLDKKASSRRYNNIAGGAALWVAAGQTPEVERGIARFFMYLAQPGVQISWHQNTGYLPLGMDGIYKQIADEKGSPLLSLAQLELVGHEHSATISRLSAQNQIRTINDEALEALFSGIKTPQQAMDDAVLRANYALLRFARNTGEEGA